MTTSRRTTGHDRSGRLRRDRRRRCAPPGTTSAPPDERSWRSCWPTTVRSPPTTWRRRSTTSTCRRCTDRWPCSRRSGWSITSTWRTARRCTSGRRAPARNSTWCATCAAITCRCPSAVFDEARRVVEHDYGFALSGGHFALTGPLRRTAGSRPNHECTMVPDGGHVTRGVLDERSGDPEPQRNSRRDGATRRDTGPGHRVAARPRHRCAGGQCERPHDRRHPVRARRGARTRRPRWVDARVATWPRRCRPTSWSASATTPSTS